MLENSEKLNNQAVTLAAKGEYDDAIACLKRAITVENENALLWFNLALTYRDAGQIAKAKAAIEYAYTINPQDEEIIETLAVLCISAGAMDEALLHCTAGLELNSLNPHFWNTAGVIHFSSADYQTAADCFEHAVSLDPHYYDAVFNLRDTYGELKNSVGVQECARLLSSIRKESQP